MEGSIGCGREMKVGRGKGVKGVKRMGRGNCWDVVSGLVAGGVRGGDRGSGGREVREGGEEGGRKISEDDGRLTLGLGRRGAESVLEDLHVRWWGSRVAALGCHEVMGSRRRR